MIIFYPLISYLLYKKQKTLKITFHPDEQLLKVNFKKGVYLIKDGHDLPARASQWQAGFYALSAHCTHLGCIVNFDPKTQKFHCPCHGSAFDISGKRIAGPAKGPLLRLPLKFMENNDIIVVLKK